MLIEKDVRNKRKSWYICDRCGEKLTGISRQLVSINNRKEADLCLQCCNILMKNTKNKEYLKDLKPKKIDKQNIREIKKPTKYDYSEEKINFLADNVTGMKLEDLTYFYNKKFNCNLTKKQIQNMKTRLRLKSGLDTRYKKGSINPWI